MTETTENIPQTPPEPQDSKKTEIFNLRGSGTQKNAEEKPCQIPEVTSICTDKTDIPPDASAADPENTENEEKPCQIPEVTFIYPDKTGIPPDARTTGPENTENEEEPEKHHIIRYLPLDHCRSYPIYKNYELRIMRSEFIPAEKEGELEIETGTVYDLLRDGQIFCIITVKPTPDFPITDAFVLYVCKKEVSLIEDVPYEMLAKSSAKEIPPWEREEPARKIDTDPTPQTIEKAKRSLNETGYAQRFEEECRGWLIYDTPEKKWYAWNESHWEPAKERLGKSLRFVADSIYFEISCWKETAEKEAEFARATGNELRVKELRSLLAAYESNAYLIHQKKGLDAMEKIAASSMLCADLEKEGTHSILTFRNGGIDCITGQYLSLQELSRHKEKYPLHYVDRSYDKSSTPAAFEKHLHDVFTDNTSDGLADAERERRAEVLTCYFKRLLGYALTPGNTRNLFVFLWGTGANGKSTTIDAVRAAIPSEIAEVSSKELLSTQEEKPTSGLYAGLLRRIMYFAEISDSKTAGGPKISRESVKILSGEKKITARALYKNSAERQNLCLPIAATNELPSFNKEPDKALMRRIVTIPFMHEFAGSAKRLDMGALLEKEGDAIFSMMVNELLAYLEAEKKQPGSGLPELPAFCRMMQGELMSGPSYNAFVLDMFEPPAENETAKVYVDDIKQMYLGWCDVRAIPVDTKLRAGSEKNPETGEYGMRRELTKGETARLNTAMEANGYKSGVGAGKKYYVCRRREQKVRVW